MDTNKHFVSNFVSFVRKEGKMKKFAPYLIPNLGTLIILGLFFAANAVGAMPLRAPVAAPNTTMISYQGQLTDPDGTPLTGTYDMHFALYAVPTGGTACWTENRTGANAVPVSDGLFNVLLGSVQAIDPSCLAGDVYLGITAGSDLEMTPRELLASVPHALQASTVPDGSITTAKIADGAVTGTKITNGAVTEAKLANGAVTASKIADGEVTNSKIANGAVTEAKLANGAVTTSKIQDGQVSNADLADNAVNSAKIQNGQVQNADLADNAVNSAKIQNGQVQNADLANGSVTPDKLDRSYVNQSGGTINGNLSVNGEVTVNRLNSPNGADLVIDANHPGYGTLTLHDTVRIPDGDLDMGGHKINNATRLSSPGASDLVIDSGAGTSRTLTLHDAVRIPDGDLDMVGNRILNVGAIVEANLQTLEEVIAERIERFELGDVLCWAGKRLERCALANDRLVVGVADENGKPIVIGTEPVKVLGPVRIGDLLVASDVAGYAMVNNQPAPGTVIAKALEEFDGEKGIVISMIRTP